jgi:hypothetical protein
MAKRPSATEDRLSALSKLRGGALTSEKVAALREALGEKSTFLVAKAAKLAGELNATALTSELVAAFNRLMTNSGADKGCEAMTAIVETLKIFGASEEDVYLRGIRHVQHEAGWGKPTDVAVGLRCESAFGLVRIGYRDALWHLAGLLADREQACRLAAARAIGASHADAGLALLKYKVLASGPEESDVVAECFSAMAEIEPGKCIPFLATYLDSPDLALAEPAALALGTTRRADALEILKDHANRSIHPALRETLLLAIATLRIEPAMAYLVSLIGQSDTKTVSQAIRALALYRRDESIRTRVAAEVAKRSEATIQQAYAKEFRVEGSAK